MSGKNQKIAAQSKSAGKTNDTKKSLIKVIVMEDSGKWIRPEKQSTHFINEDAALPDVTFEIETAETGPYEWKWKIKWDAKVSGLKESADRGKLLKTFEESGSVQSNEKIWKMNFDSKVLGGLLTVEIKAGSEEFKRSIFIRGKNPTKEKIKNYSDSLEGTKGFEKILMHEALGKNFINADGEPVVSFDSGYGITQMTNPAPSYEQCWSWKENIKGGGKIYKDKRKDAVNYLKSKTKDYTEEQVDMETYSRYNGGAYYEWNDKEKKFSPKDFICDSQIANVGWSPSNELNKGKTTDELRKRDSDQFKLGTKGQSKDHPWVYTGVCYAKSVNSK
jgi:hypothetical protein